MYIQVSGDELLLDDSRRLAGHACQAGVEVRLDDFGGERLQHTFQFSAGRAPEADEAIRRLAERVRPRLGLADAAGRPTQPNRRIAPAPRGHVAEAGDHLDSTMGPPESRRAPEPQDGFVAGLLPIFAAEGHR